ncbi:MAG TPA: hypothetical protein VGK35_07930 [Actinotalea sp.]
MKKPACVASLLAGGIALLAGLDGGLLLLGLPAPVSAARLPQVHGPLLVLGFVGTVVALERAVALRRWWGGIAPVALGLGALLVLSPAPAQVGQVVMVAGTVGQLVLYAGLWRRAESAALALQVLGAVLATGGALLWWGGAAVAVSLPWLAGYLVLTIAGERLELARVVVLPRGVEAGVLALGTCLVAGAVAATLWPGVGHALLGAALLGLVGVLVVHDVARRTVTSTGLPRYMGWCLLAGYAWLVVAGALWLLAGAVTEGRPYDAVVHAVFLGFTLSMIMAHAPVILPAVLGRPLPYRPAFYVPVVLLHGSLVLRVLGGDMYGQAWALKTGGALNVLAVLAFLVVAGWSSAHAVPAAAARVRVEVAA